MLIIPPAQFRRRRGRARAAADAPPPPPPVEVFVVNVTTVPGLGNQADFYFSAPVIVIADFTTDIWIEIPGFGPEFPLVSTQIAADVVRFTFGDEGIEGGLPWEVTNVPSNLDLNGATMPVPQNGLVE